MHASGQLSRHHAARVSSRMFWSLALHPLAHCRSQNSRSLDAGSARRAKRDESREGAESISTDDVYIAPSSARSIQSVADLASAWSQVARRLPAAVEYDEMLIIAALKLSLSYLQLAQPRLDGRLPSARAVQLASNLADLSAAGLPLDAEAVAAGIVLEACESGQLDHLTIEETLGPGVAVLVHDVLRVRTAPHRVEVYDDVAASAIREWCLAFHDVRANVLEVTCRWDELQHMGNKLPLYERQLLALEALQFYAPLGHALGLGPVCAGMEDLCFKVLFPQSYNHTSKWLCNMLDEAEDALFQCRLDLLAKLDNHEEFKQLANSCVIRARTKSLFSIMKKLLRVGNMSDGGRQREEIYDILGMRAVVQPREDLPIDEREEAARRACFIVQQVAENMWPPVCDRTKDYISEPKANGYQSMHLTLCLLPQFNADAFDQACIPEDLIRAAVVTASMASVDEDMLKEGALSAPYLELQIRTKGMDDRAESGDAAHTAYKGGLDSRQARQLQAWSKELQNRLASKQQAKLTLPEQSTPAGHNSNSVEALFRYLDKDNSGRISVDELRLLLREMLPKWKHQSPARQMNGSQQHLQDTSEDQPDDAEALLMLLEGVGDDAEAGKGESSPLFSEGGGEMGMTLPEFARFLKKVVLVNALSRLDKESISQLTPVPFLGQTAPVPQ